MKEIIRLETVPAEDGPDYIRGNKKFAAILLIVATLLIGLAYTQNRPEPQSFSTWAAYGGGSSVIN